MLAILLLKTMESLENGLQPHSGVAPLYSMRTVSLASLQSCRSVDADAQWKRALISKTCLHCKVTKIQLFSIIILSYLFAGKPFYRTCHRWRHWVVLPSHRFLSDMVCYHSNISMIRRNHKLVLDSFLQLNLMLLVNL